MKNNFLKSFAAAAAVPVIILLLMTVAPIITMLFGREITLKTEPYDPRDLFRGDYVMLNYKINNIETSKLSKELVQQLEGKSYAKIKNKKLFAVLKEADGAFEVDYVTNKRPKDRLYMNCRLKYYSPGNEMVQLDYNMDKYFVPENTGKDLEKLSRSGELTARVRVLNGYALLEKVSGQ